MLGGDPQFFALAVKFPEQTSTNSKHRFACLPATEGASHEASRCQTYIARHLHQGLTAWNATWKQES